jgi:hypothetical protein
MELVTRAEALATGRKRYFTGKPCKHGHFKERMTANKTCAECLRLTTCTWKAANPEIRNAAWAPWAARNAEYLRTRPKRPEPKEQVNARSRRNYGIDPTRVKAANKKWNAENTAKVRAKDARRKARLLQASPVWADSAAVLGWYEARVAAEEFFRIPVHVDHVVPLQSKAVSGLHVEDNLRLMPGAENSRKGNRHWPNMWESVCAA